MYPLTLSWKVKVSMHLPSEPSRDCTNIHSRRRREACKVDPVMVAVNLPGICLSALLFNLIFFFFFWGYIRQCAVLYSKFEPQEVFIPALVRINSSTLNKHVHLKFLYQHLNINCKKLFAPIAAAYCYPLLNGAQQWPPTFK